MRPHKVALVVDAEFGSQLDALALRRHVWIVDSPTNKAAVHNVWESQRGDKFTPLETGATVFDPQGSTPSEWCLSILETVEEHHAALNTLEVIGVELSEQLRSALASLGYARLSVGPEGFVAYREGSVHD